MAQDKFSATWVSHSSIGDFLKCPRAYYLNNVYRDPKTNHKISLMQPPLALGQAVHSVLESLSVLPVTERFNRPLVDRFEETWQSVTGELGGFVDTQTELKYKNRGIVMLNRVKNNPGPFAKKAVKINNDLPHYWLSEDDNIILCGKIDWLEYLAETDSVHIIDFKTGKNTEDSDSLQLPIYLLLVHNCQHRQVDRASYWYLETDNELTDKPLPDLETAQQKVLSIAKKIKLARQFEKFACHNGEAGCFACKPLEQIVSGEAKFVGVNDYKQDIYILTKQSQPESTIL